MGSTQSKSVFEFEDQSLVGPEKHSLDEAPLRALYSGGANDCCPHVLKNSVADSIRIVVFSAKINLLMPFGPLAIVVDKLTGHHGWVFLLSLLGIIPLAERLGYATEVPNTDWLLLMQAAGLLYWTNSMIRVVQQSLLGSILSNMLLVLGCAFFAGGLVHSKTEQVFNKGTAGVNSGLLLMAVMGLLFPAVLHSTRTELHYGKSELSLSRFTSCIMLVAYASFLFFQLRSQHNLYIPVNQAEDQTEENSDEEEAPEITKWESIIWLSILTAWISVLSEYLVNAIEGASVAMGIPVAFISVILLPIVGNAAEHAGAVMFAMKDKLIPFCVVVGWCMGCPMDLDFQLFETATLFITVLVVAFMLQEGTSNYFKGLMLILCYIIVAASFFVHRDPKAILFHVEISTPDARECVAISLSLPRKPVDAGRGGGRDRFPESRGGHGLRRLDSKGGKAPPSRNLWVGNLSHSTVEEDLVNPFLQFGELESVAFHPGRSYAFLKFKREDDAIAAMDSLQDLPVAGNPLRIEFTKADKSSAPSREEDYSQRRDEQRTAPRGSPFYQMEFRARQDSPEQFYQEKSNMSDKNAEPSAVLWIGFPALLKVDEMILRKAFSPFGEIEKITAFPGRTYAFVRFRSEVSACRAKEALQGKLFGNPRVHICFAKSETGSANSGRNSMSVPPSPHFQVNGRSGSSENFREDTKFGSFTGNPSIRSPHYFPDFDAVDSDPYGFKRKGNLWRGENNMFEQRRYKEMRSELGLSEDMYDPRGSPKREKYSHLNDYSQRFPQTSQPYEEPWDLPEDIHLFHGAKKLKTESFLSNKEFPEYPQSDYNPERHGFSRSYSDFPQADSSNRNFEGGPFGYNQIPDRPMSLPPALEERGDRWKESYDDFQVSSGSQLANPVDRRRFTPERDRPSFNVWKWEGTIAKGGTPVCNARCFPVGKLLDFTLPEFLDCTARTGLDMLSKHYYQAASAWVVFFAPQSDADIGYYNEFMHYLGEKQRAAVAKLDDKNTLFLVPPSDFSEKVLKVPGKLSISGVVLRLENPSSNFGSVHQQPERKDMRLLSLPGDTSYTKPSTASESIHSFTSAPPVSFSGSAYGVGNGSDSYNESRHEYPHHMESPALGRNWSSHKPQNSIMDTRNKSTQMPNSSIDSILQEHRIMQREAQQSSIPGGISRIRNSHSSQQEIQSPGFLSMPSESLQPEQLAQLASSLGQQQRQSARTPNPATGEDFRQRNTMNESDNIPRTSQTFGMQNNEVNSQPSTSQFGQVQQLQQRQQQVSTVPAAPHTVQTAVQGNQQLQSTSTNEAVETDPQKRLQATLQLAAALLQQIQGKGS
ncbi:hypothetical protein ACFX1Q_045785 [Malus domestica]